MIEGHTSRAFDGALAALHMRVIEMGGLVLDQVREAAVAYTEWDLKAAERVVDRAAYEYDEDGSTATALSSHRRPSLKSPERATSEPSDISGDAQSGSSAIARRYRAIARAALPDAIRA